MSDKLIVVDRNDDILGFKEKWECHQGEGIRHRAYSVFVFNDNCELLIQKRSRHKRLFGDYWSNSCCSHPRQGEERVKSAERRLIEELGFTCKLDLILKFMYQARFRDVGSENEFNAILFGMYDDEVKANPEEISDYKWVEIDWLKKDMKKKPEIYSPWFLIGLEKFMNGKHI